MKLYFVKCNWYNYYEDEDKIDSCFVFGNNLNDAALRVEKAFPYINSVTFEELNTDAEDYIFYIPSPCENLDEIKEANIY